ncbi:uncharacterized protein [Dysidea avara]|uniref:uncharacterized protein n=1 Tax=Dysidea avara TaxID=196820 RepID=UPI0033253E33
MNNAERKFNVVVYGIPECPQKTNRQLRTKQDLENVIDAMSKADNEIESNDIKDLYRLGKYDHKSQRPRPLLIKFLRSNVALDILSSKNKLEAPIYIKPDLTPFECQKERLLLKERRSLIDNGTERRNIKMRNDSLYVNNKLHCKVSTDGTESHLTETIQNSEMFPNNFHTYRKDRNNYGGGVFVSVKNTVHSSQIDTDSPIEIVWTYVHVGKNNDVIVGSFYCPPHSTDTVLEDLQSSVNAIKQKYPRIRVILGGDFNCPGIDWEHGTLTESYVPCHFREKLITLAEDTQMSQLVTFPTRRNNTLDLCFTTHPDSVLSCEPIPGFSDHDAVILSVQTPTRMIKQHPRTIYLYKSADWDTIREKLSELSHIYFELNNSTPQNLDENWMFFAQNLQQVIKDHTPTKLLSTRTHLPWMSTTLKRLIRKKQRVYNRARHHHRENDWLEYKSLQKEVDHKLKHQHKSYVTNLISASNNKKPLWHYLKTRKQGNCGISTLKDPQSSHTLTDPFDKANILNQHFKSVFTIEDTSTIPDKGPSLFPSLPMFEITEQGVYNLLSNCDSSKSPGPDSIHPYVLKTTATKISPILTHIFKQSLESGTVPSE